MQQTACFVFNPIMAGNFAFLFNCTPVGRTSDSKLQPSLSERVIVDGHGCHTALHFGVKAKENQDKVPTLYLLPKLHKKPIKQDLLQILVLVRQQNFLNC